jgi:mRNA interferase RelE/StbE
VAPPGNQAATEKTNINLYHSENPVKASLEIILSEPHSGKALKDDLLALRSFRIGSFRIIYRIKVPEQIELVAIGPRGRIYEETFRIIQKEAGK